MNDDRLKFVCGRYHGKSYGGGKNKFNNRQNQNNNYNGSNEYHKDEYQDRSRYKIDRNAHNKFDVLDDIESGEDHGHYNNKYNSRYNVKNTNKFKNRSGDNKRGSYNNNTRIHRNYIQNTIDQEGQGSRSCHIMSDSAWYKITLCQIRQEDKDELLDKLFQVVGHQFETNELKMDKNNLIFFVDEEAIANKLVESSRQVIKNDGYKMVILKSKCPRPLSEMNSENTEKLKLAMSRRYDPNTKVLDLSDFSNDHQLKASKLFVALSRPAVVETILKIIKENIPEIVGLDLSHNRLFTLTYMRTLPSIALNLIALNLSHNQLKSPQSLQPLRKLPIVELKLVGNTALCSQYKDKLTKYASDVQDVFPKLTKLDDNDLEPATTFEVDDIPQTLPASMGSHYHSEELEKVLKAFIVQYIELYDSKQRDQLFEAYHDKAKFSLTVALPSNQPRLKNDFSRYMGQSRNFIRNTDSNRKFTTLKSTRLSILKVFDSLPRTKHDLSSFKVDVGYASENMIQFTVNGIFKEVGGNCSSSYRCFSRMFITIPKGQGMLIVNECLHLTNISDALQRVAFTKNTSFADEPVAQHSTAVVQHPTASVQVPVAHAPVVVHHQQAISSKTIVIADADLTQTQRELVHRFMSSSNMNSNWSQMCLKQNDWDFNKAGEVFYDLKAKDKIPKSAFQS